MKCLMFAVKSSTKAELLNGIMYASAHINDKPSLIRSVTSPSRRATMCIDNKGGRLQQLFSSLSISNYFINFIIVYRNFINVS
jgi:hypothetical protein